MSLRRASTGLAGRIARQQGVCCSGSSVLASHAAELLPAVQLAGAEAAAGVRHASQLAVKQRMRSVTNIQKITKAMKMVAASKMRAVQTNTQVSRGIVNPLIKLLGDHPGIDVPKNLTVPITTDKGLCGGINSTVTKYTRGVLRTIEEQEGKEEDIVVIGEKGRAQLQRLERDKIRRTIADIAKARITFPQVCTVSEELLKTEYDVARLIFNKFQSAIAYKPTIATVLSPSALEKAAEAGSTIDSYEIEGPDRAEFLQDLAEFQLAVVLYNSVLENSCSEQASRMAAMENSTKNASEMLQKLTLSYNRSRQAAITTELTEIISGAAALEK